MYTRQLKPPQQSFFLFGPRATGKTTWLKQHFKKAKWFNLLNMAEIIRISRDPERFRQEISALKKGSWVVIDEIQKMPSLLDEVHSLMNEYGKAYKFALTGSSARKLKRSDVNLLAGRAINRIFFPLTSRELDKDFEINSSLMFGHLPAVCNQKDAPSKIDILEAYVTNYLKEEIKQEALVRKLEPFVRFLEVAALANGQITNMANIARDAGVSRPTVQGYFSVLVDTLIGNWLPSWQPKARIKEVAHPKFYFFDCGVVRTLAGMIHNPLGIEERGALFETLIFSELKAHLAITQCGGNLSYWRSVSGREVDFIWTRGRSHAVGIEAKASQRWKKEFGLALKELYEQKKLNRCIGVYCGKEVLKDGPVTVYPAQSFLEQLHNGNLF